MSFAHLTIATTNVDSTTDFLVDVMGWREIPVPSNVDIDVRWIDVGNGGQLHVLNVSGFSTSEFETEYGRHFAFFASTENLRLTKTKLKRLGVPLVEPIRKTPFERIFFRDPNGYMFEVINRDEWSIES